MKANLMSMNILVDSSGSMESIASDMVGALNQLVDENRELDVLVTYSIFSNEYQPIFADVPIKNVKRFELKPDSMTALVESACKMIDEVGARLAAMPEEERPEKVMFVIVTDGLENHSKPKYTRKRLMKKIKRQTEVYNWLFLYLGANQDAIAVAESYGIAADKAVGYEPGKARMAGKVLSRNLCQAYRSFDASAFRNVGFDDEDRAELGED
jgi:hypothetical protein